MKELLEKYPKAAKVVREYYLNKLLESLKDKGLPEGFKEEVKKEGVPEDRIISLLEANPAALMEVFDENEIYIHIGIDYPEIGEHSPIMFTFDTGRGEINTFLTRKGAEKEAIIKAFSLLEEKL